MKEEEKEALQELIEERLEEKREKILEEERRRKAAEYKRREEEEEKEKLYMCSFCGKNPEEVKQIFVGENVGICNECILVAYTIIKEEKTKSY